MRIARREFLRSGVAVAAVAAADCGCARLTANGPGKPAGGWDQVPGILSRIVPPTFPERDFSVLDYGALPDGRTNCAPAFAAAITACNNAGGGRVVVPAARQFYLLNGPIQLLSNVNLYLEAGSYIHFGANAADYLPVVEVRYQGIRCKNYSPFVYAYQQSNIAITGAGTLVGQAYYWGAWEGLAAPDWTALQTMASQGVPVEQRVFGPGHHLRLTMFEPYECKNILVEGVTFEGSPFWTLHPTFCTNVTIRNVTVLAGQSNDDGCDPDSCTDVLIDGCMFTTNDDNVSIKAGYASDAQGLPSCSNIVVRNCVATNTEWGGFTIGSNTACNIENVFFDNCVTHKSVSAFLIKSNRLNGGTVKNVFVRNSKAGDCQQFLSLVTQYAGVFSGPAPPLFNNVNLEGMTCGQAGATAFLFDGDPANPIIYVSLADIAIGSAANAQSVSNTFFVASSGVTIGGKPVTIEGIP